MTYLIIKSLHIISVITWMAGLLYLPRLFVYHSEANIGSEFSEKLKIMEKKLTIIIIFPSYEKALEWYHSEEYKPVRQIRLDNADTNQIIIKGV